MHKDMVVKMNIDIEVNPGINCLFSNLTDLINHSQKCRLKEYQTFLLSDGLYCEYWHSDNRSLADNFICHDLDETLQCLCEEIKGGYELCTAADEISPFIKRNIDAGLPILVIVRSEILKHHKPPEYFQNIPARHVLIVKGYDDGKREYAAVDTYVTGPEQEAYYFAIPYSSAEKILSAAVIHVNESYMFDCIYANKKIKKFLYEKNGLAALNSLAEDLSRLRLKSAAQERDELLGLLYFLKIRFSFFNYYLRDIIKASGMPYGLQMETIHMANSLFEDWKNYFNRILLTAHFYRNSSIQKLVDRTRCIYNRQFDVLHTVVQRMDENR